MIATRDRLANSRQIKRVLQKGVTRSGSFFRLKALRNPRLLSSSRLAVVVSKKISNKAVVRNLIKRRSGAVFAGELGKTVGYDIVVFPSRLVESADFEKLKEDAKQCLRNLAFLR
jgi:ribonuclease P protein component